MGRVGRLAAAGVVMACIWVVVDGVDSKLFKRIDVSKLEDVRATWRGLPGIPGRPVHLRAGGDVAQ